MRPPVAGPDSSAAPTVRGSPQRMVASTSNQGAIAVCRARKYRIAQVAFKTVKRVVKPVVKGWQQRRRSLLPIAALDPCSDISATSTCARTGLTATLLPRLGRGVKLPIGRPMRVSAVNFQPEVQRLV